jgi:hypothetical protein
VFSNPPPTHPTPLNATDKLLISFQLLRALNLKEQPLATRMLANEHFSGAAVTGGLRRETGGQHLILKTFFDSCFS